MARLRCFAMLLAASAISGCSVGGGSPVADATYTLKVNWPARSRDADAPASARTVVLQMWREGRLVARHVRARSGAAAHSIEIVSDAPAPFGAYQIDCRFYSGGDASAPAGDLVARADQGIWLGAGANTLPEIFLTGLAASLELPSIQPAAYAWDEPTSLTATAKTSTGAVLAVDPGAFQFTSAGPNLKIGIDGRASSRRDGDSQVTCRLDGLTAVGQVRVGPSQSAGGSVTPNYMAIAEGTGAFHRWARYPLRIHISPQELWSQNREAEFREAAAEWTAATGASFVYTDSSNEADWDIHVIFAPLWSFPAPAGGSTTWEAENGVNTRARIRLAGDHPGPRLPLALHEIGHALGLTRHSSSSHDVMSFPPPAVLTVSQRDANTLLTAHGGSLPLRP